jgi:hypothetical protein
MRRKVSTIMEESLFRRSKLAAAAEGRALSSLIEDALRRYLDGPPDVPATCRSVDETWGAMAAPPELVRQVLEDEDEYVDD